jgi:hypothetical protein
MKLYFSRQSFEKYPHIKVYENPPSASRVVPYGRTGRHTDVTKLTAPFHSFADTPKKLNQNTEQPIRNSKQTRGGKDGQ